MYFFSVVLNVLVIAVILFFWNSIRYQPESGLGYSTLGALVPYGLLSEVGIGDELELYLGLRQQMH